MCTASRGTLEDEKTRIIDYSCLRNRIAIQVQKVHCSIRMSLFELNLSFVSSFVIAISIKIARGRAAVFFCVPNPAFHIFVLSSADSSRTNVLSFSGNSEFSSSTSNDYRQR